MNEAVAAYKKSLMAYIALAGSTPELDVYHLKLVDVIDSYSDGNFCAANDELSMLAFSLIRKLANHVVSLIDSMIESHRKIHSIKSMLVSRITHIDDMPELNKCQAHQMILHAINAALQELGAITNVSYVDLKSILA